MTFDLPDQPTNGQFNPQSIAGPEVPPEVPPPPRGVAIVLVPSLAWREANAVPDGVPVSELHVTLAYLGKTDVQPPGLRQDLFPHLIDLANRPAPTGSVSGAGVFPGVEGGARDCHWAAISSMDVDQLRQEALAALASAGMTRASEHGFVPHIAMSFGPPGYLAPSVMCGDITFEAIALWVGVDHVVFPFLAESTVPANLPIAPPEPPAPAVPTAPAVPVPAPVLDYPLQPKLYRAVPFDAGGDSQATWNGEDHNREQSLGRIRSWASADGSGDWSKVDWDKYARAFLYVDEGRADTFSAYRLPHHDVVEGKLVVSRKALQSAAASFLNGTHGVPEQDLGEVRLHMERHFSQFGMDPPWRAREVEPVQMASSSGSDTPGVVSSTWIQVAKIGRFLGHPAGPFQFDPSVFDRIITNFERTQNQRIPVDFEHATERMDGTIPHLGAPAVGWIVELDNRGEQGLWGRVDWVDSLAVKYIREGRYRFFSPAVVFDAIDPVTGASVGPQLVSGGLTNRPFLDGMEPLTARNGAAPVTASAKVEETPVAPVVTHAKSEEPARTPVDAAVVAATAAVRNAEEALVAATAGGTAITAEALADIRGSFLLRLDALLPSADLHRAIAKAPTTELRGLILSALDSLPADSATCVQAVVAALRAVPVHKIPLADGDAWDAASAVRGLREWALTEEGAVDWAKYKLGFAWFDETVPEDYISYKLPHHEIVDGKLMLSRRGVDAAMRMLNGDFGGAGVPEADRVGVHRHLAAHYQQWSDEVPTLLVLSDRAEPAVSVCAAANNDVTHVGTSDISEGVTTENTNAPASVVVETEPTPAPAADPIRAERFKGALVAARTGGGVTAMRWYEGIDDRGDLLDFLRMCFGLQDLATEAEVMGNLTRLKGFLANPADAERSGISAPGIVGHMRSCLNMPVMTTADEVIAKIESAMGTLPVEMGPGTTDVTVPGASYSAAKIKEPSRMSIEQNPEVAKAEAEVASLKITLAAKDQEIATLRSDASSSAAAVAALKAQVDAINLREAEADVDVRVRAGVITQSARGAAIKLRLGSPEDFVALYPTPAVQPAPVVDPGTPPAAPRPAAMSDRQDAPRALMQPVTMGAGGQSPPASGDKHTQTAKPRDARLHEETVAIMKANSGMTYRQAMEQADRSLS